MKKKPVFPNSVHRPSVQQLILTTLFGLLPFLFTGCRKELKPATGMLPDKQYIKGTASLTAFSPAASFKVMSFNIRRDQPGDPESIVQRRGKILQIVKDHLPDIFGLQEFQDDSIKTWFIAQVNTIGYSGYYETPTGSSPKAIFYKRDRFSLKRAGVEKIIDAPQSDKTYWAVLEDLSNSADYFITNTHWNPSEQSYRQINAERHAAMILRENSDNLPLIAFGDYNASPTKSEISYFKNLLSVADAMGDSTGGKTFHGWDDIGDGKIDYIFLSGDLAYSHSTIINTSYNGLWPSDHWPVITTIYPSFFDQEHLDASGLSVSQYTNFLFGDINGDGKKDKIFWRYNYNSGIPRVYLSDGNGSFISPPVDHAAAASGLAGTKYYYADVNGDGKDDQILWDPAINGGKTTVYLATTNGNFSNTAIINPEGLSGVAATVFHFADINGDGMADKIFWRYNYSDGVPRVFFATGGGHFNNTYIASTASGISTVSGTNFFYSDINGDGKADRIVWHPTLNSGKPSVYLSNGDGTFTLSSTLTNTGLKSEVGTTIFQFADVNGDGLSDKIFWRSSYYLGRTAVNLAQANNTFSETIFSLSSISTDPNTRFFYYDINGDGKADMLKWNYNEDGGKFKTYLAR